ncbi:uncharacterized protein G2W53_043820 [Senna tora]|uniref:Uncharacterized protein n=1 Tax=Senna tora TaxID=362788 RepID=A0A834W5A8_9FABA|nr:uncharacterized protein G2W53_043820 [Senna tora]
MDTKAFGALHGIETSLMLTYINKEQWWLLFCDSDRQAFSGHTSAIFGIL